MTEYYLTPEHYEIAEENGISKKIVNDRFYYKGWTAERAITQPVMKKSDHNWSKWRHKAKVTKSTYLKRIRRGWNEKEAALTPSYRQKKFRRKETRFFTEEQEQTMKENNISYHTAYSRIKKYGWTKEKAITTPVIKPKEALKRAREKSPLFVRRYGGG